MTRTLLLSVVFYFAVFTVAKAQKENTLRKDTTTKPAPRVDTLKYTYVNVGKIEARKSAIRSMMVPGWGQISNGITVYRLAKVAAIYTGATLLTLSFIDNNSNYKIFLNELTYRQANGDRSPAGSIYASYPTSGLILAKDTYRRNREVIIFSFIALYGVNIIEAYIDARLKYFDVGEDLSFKITPATVPVMGTYGYAGNAHPMPALKLSLRL